MRHIYPEVYGEPKFQLPNTLETKETKEKDDLLDRIDEKIDRQKSIERKYVDNDCS